MESNPVTMTTLAFRVKNMNAMTAFYREAFGAKFRPVNTGGLASQFGEAVGLTFKFVPIRDAADFTGFPVHQPGFRVADVTAVIALAVKHGGRQEGEIIREGNAVQAAVRDPDGNTIELYQQ
jgi:catechol 2,3-dioxygenase-like lactoylglutathione lyase family enzyme